MCFIWLFLLGVIGCTIFGSFVFDLPAEFRKPQEISGYMHMFLRQAKGIQRRPQVEVDIHDFPHLKRLRRQV